MIFVVALRFDISAPKICFVNRRRNERSEVVESVLGILTQMQRSIFMNFVEKNIDSIHDGNTISAAAMNCGAYKAALRAL
jgi:hypothetical protein